VRQSSVLGRAVSAIQGTWSTKQLSRLAIAMLYARCWSHAYAYAFPFLRRPALGGSSASCPTRPCTSTAAKLGSADDHSRSSRPRRGLRRGPSRNGVEPLKVHQSRSHAARWAGPFVPMVRPRHCPAVAQRVRERRIRAHDTAAHPARGP